jgi:hypothetical protein
VETDRFTEREQRKEEEHAAKQKSQREERERKHYEDMYGQEAMKKADQQRGEDFDPEEDFW